MKERGLLQSQVIKAWKDCVGNDYLDQRINSESGLLVFFCHYLIQILPKTRRIFVEPEIKITITGKTNRVFPDIVICNTKEVIGVIELKYLPRALPQVKKDLNSLTSLAKHRKKITISNERFRGIPGDDKTYTLSDNILFVWAGIHASTDKEIPIDKALQGCFLELHAETKANNNPKIFDKIR